jgi:hypothetical protein
MFDGFHWYSDFRQRDFWPGPDYRKHQPMYRLYRWTGESTEIKPSFRVTR